MSELLLGPILYARPSTTDEWCFSVHIVTVDDTDDPPGEFSPKVSGDPDDTNGADPIVGEPVLVHRFVGQPIRVWGWGIRVARGDTDLICTYQINGNQYGPVAIPGRRSLPRFAFFSCNGFSNPADVHKVRKPELLWEDLLRRHEEGLEQASLDDQSGLHLLIGGGDQIYCDALWQKAPLDRLAQEDEEGELELTRRDRSDILARYIEWYVEQWGRPAFGSACSRIPCVFTWDDHDIFDGWGSHPAERQASALHQAVFGAAREAFSAFQIGGEASPLLRRSEGHHYLQSLTLDSVEQSATVVFLDLRSDRSITQVLSDHQWSDLSIELGTFEASGDGRERYLLLVSSIPVVYRGTKLEGTSAESLGLEDDRRDQWEHGSRRGERTRLVTKVFDAIGNSARGTIVSGDVHVASRGQIVSSWPEHRMPGLSTGIVHQVTATAIVHPAPTWLQWAGLGLFSDDSPSPVGEGIGTEILRMTPEEHFIRARNYVIGCFARPSQDGPGALWFQWIRERDSNGDPRGEAVPEQLVIRGVRP